MARVIKRRVRGYRDHLAFGPDRAVAPLAGPAMTREIERRVCRYRDHLAFGPDRVVAPLTDPSMTREIERRVRRYPAGPALGPDLIITYFARPTASAPISNSLSWRGILCECTCASCFDRNYTNCNEDQVRSHCVRAMHIVCTLFVFSMYDDTLSP